MPTPDSAASCAASRTSQVGFYPTCAHLMPISGKPEIGGRPILRDGRYATIALLGSARTCALLRMRRINVQHLVISIQLQREPL